MFYRSAIRRIVVQSQQQQQARKYSLLAGDRALCSYSSIGLWRSGATVPRVLGAPQLEETSSGDGGGSWDQNLRDHLGRSWSASYANLGKCSNITDLDRNAGRTGPHAGEQSGSYSSGGLEGRISGRSITSNYVSSTQIPMLGYSGEAFNQSFGRYDGFSRGGRVRLGSIGSENIRFYRSTTPALGGNLELSSGEQLDALAGVTGSASTVASVATTSGTRVISEVAAAAADCSYPTAAVQYFIEGVHLTTGLPWWASIAATTVAIRVMVLPILIYQMKATARLTLMRPELEKLTNHIKENNYDPKIVEENQQRMKTLFQQHKTSPLSPILGAFVQAPIFMCFFFAIRNMAERVESFKEGGALWFTDLSTPDSFFIMPVLSGAMFLLTVELGATDGMQGQPMLGKMKMALRGLAILLVPLTASFPKALFCYWLTANVCSIVQAAVFKQPGVKGALGIPDVSHMAKPSGPIAPVMTFSQPPRSQPTGAEGGETRVGTYKKRRR